MDNRVVRLPALVLAAVMVCLPGSVSAQAELILSRYPSMEGIRVFEPGYFMEFDPVTAMDLVQRTPGFSPQEQSGGRGLAGVRSNILINGKRPPPKGQSIWQRLNNRPYSSVVRLELIDTGADNSIDMQGYTQVLNVILEDESTDYYELGTEYMETGDGDVQQRNEHYTDINLIGNFTLGGQDFSLRAGTFDLASRQPSGFVDIDPANPQQRVATQNEFMRDEQYLELSGNFLLPDDSSLSVSAEINEQNRGSMPVALGGSGAVSESFQSAEDRRELSGEYLRPIGERLELMIALLDSRNINDSDSSFAVRDSLLTSVRNQESGETAGRVRLQYKLNDELTLRSSLSSAFNYFTGTYKVLENGIPQSLAGSDSRVEEDRHSLTLEADWNLRENWILRGSLSGGKYALEARDRPANKQTEVKGLASVAWQPRDRTTITWESRYDIGQLSLSQFLASSSLSSEILQAGAVRLDSESNWEHQLRYDQRFGDRGVLKLTIGHFILENPIRAVPLSDSLVVSQNTFAEKVSFFNSELEYPFERFDMKDLLLKASLDLRRTETIDPVTREKRDVSWAEPVEWSLGLRKNPGEGKWTWELSLWKSVNNKNFGVRDTRYQQRSHEWRGFIQWEPVNGLRLSARMDSPRSEFSLSEFYSAVRYPGLDPAFIAYTSSRRESAPSFTVQWRRSKYMEITATINPRPRFSSKEVLSSFDGSESSLQAREIARGPRAEIRFRLYNR